MIIEITRSREPIEEQDILQLEELLEISLPPSYKNFLLTTNGGRPKPAGFPISNNPSDTHGIIDFLFCIKDKDIYNLYTWAGRYRERIPKDMLPIALDLVGNLICLVVRGEDEGKIYFWDHEEEVEEGQVPGFQNVYFVAQSFGDLLDNLIDV